MLSLIKFVCKKEIQDEQIDRSRKQRQFMKKGGLIKVPYKEISSQVNITKSQNLSNIHLASYFYSLIPLIGRSPSSFFTMSIIGTQKKLT